jgi:hypothetical protein
MSVDDFRKEEFDQSDILGMRRFSDPAFAQTHANAGICQELCWKWMKRLKTKTNVYATPKQRMAALWKDNTVDKAVNRHNQLHASFGALYSHRLYGIPDPEVKSRFKYDADFFEKWMLGAGGLFIAFRSPRHRHEKHAISAYSHKITAHALNPPILFFDSNHGEYETKGGYIFTHFFKAFLEEKYSATSGDIDELAIYA